jgi:hypothetical protein
MTRLFVMPVKTGIQYLFIPGYRPGPCRYDAVLDTGQAHAGVTPLFVFPAKAGNQFKIPGCRIKSGMTNVHSIIT